MSEMSLYQQIHQIDNVMKYIELICKETNNLNKNITNSIVFLRQNGLRKETADKIEHEKMAQINDKLEPMLERMKKEDYVYLRDLRDDLVRVANS